MTKLTTGNEFVVVDFETTSLPSFKRTANPLDPRNQIVYSGVLSQDGQVSLLKMLDKKGKENRDPTNIPYERISHIIGQNIKFDILYIYESEKFQEWLRNGGQIWDTMVAEYLLSGQEVQYPSLDYLSNLYGGFQKDHRVTTMFEAGKGSHEIPEYLLLPYLEADLRNTHLVAIKQFARAQKAGMLPLMKVAMNHVLALCEMEYNGLYLNVDVLQELRTAYEKRLSELYTELNQLCSDIWKFDLPFDPKKRAHLQHVLFGQSFKAKVKRPVYNEDGSESRFLGGKTPGAVKMRLETVTLDGVGIGLLKPAEEPPNSIDEKHLLNYYGRQDKADQIISKVLELRTTEKRLHTYIFHETKHKKKDGTIIYKRTGLLPLRYPRDGCVHHTLDCVKTITGRLNSRGPNGQNLAKDLLPMFTSRYGDQGKIVSFDFSQLEVCVQAYLSQSPKLIQDIKDGVDFHTKRLSYWTGKPYEELIVAVKADPYWKEQRFKAKTVSFQKAYGARPEKIAATTGLPLTTIQDIFAKEDAEYPEVRQYYDAIAQEVQASSMPTQYPLDIRTKRGHYIQRPNENKLIGYHKSLTGKLYHFNQHAVLTKLDTIFRYYKTTEMENYSIQGFAETIVSMMVGRVYRFMLHHRDKGIIINEVHDELLLDIRIEHLTFVTENVKIIISDVKGALKEIFGLELNVPITVDMNIGNSWGECK